MRTRHVTRAALRCVTGTLAVAGAAYVAHAAFTWLRYGTPTRPRADDEDALLDRFLPEYEVVERMRRHVRAPANVTLSAAESQDLMGTPGVNLIFLARQCAMGVGLRTRELPTALIDQVKALGWVELARTPGREIVMGAVTQPWKGEVTFRSIPPAEFARFAEPGYVKIAWTLRADPVGPGASIFRSETRALATDPAARARFRTYWSLVAPGVWLIRRLSAAPMAADAERRHLHAA